MERPDSSSLAVIEDPDAAALLADLEQLRPLLPFMGRERTVSEVATELELKVDAMYYRVKRLEALGLLRAVRRLPRKGRAMTTYRASAEAFFVPLATIPQKTVEELLEQGDAGQRRRVAASMAAAMRDASPFLTWGVHVRRGPDGEPSVSLGPAEPGWEPAQLLERAAPAIVSSWVPLRLGFEDAKTLQRELFELIGRYAGRQGPQDYLLGLALAPVGEEP